MFAIIRAGGKQYKVQAGDTVRVEKLEKNLGDQFDLADVLMIGGGDSNAKSFVGSPLLQGAIVTAVVTRQAKAPKIIVFKKKRRQGYRKMQGHRQLYTELFIQSITTPEGIVTKTEKNARVIDPAKSAARKAAGGKKTKVNSGEVAAAPKKKAAAKKPAGAAKKSTATKKAAGKKTATKK